MQEIEELTIVHIGLELQVMVVTVTGLRCWNEKFKSDAEMQKYCHDIYKNVLAKLLEDKTLKSDERKVK